jgi:hypothetical protein
VWVGDLLRVFESVLRLVKSCVFRPLDRRQASGHTLRCVRYEPTVIYNYFSLATVFLRTPEALALRKFFSTLLSKLDLRFNRNMGDAGEKAVRDAVKDRSGFELML